MTKQQTEARREERVGESEWERKLNSALGWRFLSVSTAVAEYDRHRL